MIALTKTLDPADLDEPELLDQLVHVDRHWDTTQHPMRRWEYAMALLALSRWMTEGTIHSRIRMADVGGAGSPFRMMTGYDTTIIDPNEPESTSAHPVEAIAPAHAEVYDVVFSISVFEHTTQPLAFLDALVRILNPGGLLFLTFDYAGDAQDFDDHYHFNWMRERMMTEVHWRTLSQALHVFGGLRPFGEVDFRDHGPQVYDYTFASLCMRKPT